MLVTVLAGGKKVLSSQSEAILTACDLPLSIPTHHRTHHPFFLMTILRFLNPLVPLLFLLDFVAWLVR